MLSGVGKNTHTVRGRLDNDVEVAWRDACAGLREWWTALRQLNDSPAYRYLRARERSAAGGSRLTNAWRMTLHCAAVLLMVCFVLIGMNRAEFGHFASNKLAMVALVLGALYLLWIALGIVQVASTALIMLAPEGTASRHELALDETMRAARLADRDFVVALLAVVGRQLWARIWSLPVVLPGTTALVHLSQAQSESTVWTPWESLAAFNPDQMQPVLVWLPLASLLLALNGWLVAQLLTLWLIAFGRGVSQRWQIHAVALSLALGQVVWGGLGLVYALTWRTDCGMPSVNDYLNWSLLPLLALALLVGSLHFARRLSSLRYAIAIGAPALAICVLLTAQLVHWIGYGPAGQLVNLSLNRWLMLTSGFALANPLILPDPALFAIPENTAWVYAAFHWYNFPLLLCFELVCLAICAHAARLSVADWRVAEE